MYQEQLYVFVKSEKMVQNKHTYQVPTTLLVLPSNWSTPKDLDTPKSDIFGFNVLSSKMLLALRSLWMILTGESR